ncbi:MAG: PaaI family thioesterase [Bacteroidetes bacterium]|nr:MAG: PaaI family thioesterase [Bacteroidota bacterium]
MNLIAKNPNFESEVREKLKKQFFMHHLGIDLSKIEAGRVEAVVTMKDALKQQNGFLHGGVTATLHDIAAGFAAFTLVDVGEVVVTADLRVSYFYPGDATKYRTVGWVVKPGNLLYFCESEVYAVYEDGSEKLISKSQSTMATVKVAVIEANRK